MIQNFILMDFFYKLYYLTKTANDIEYISKIDIL